MKYINIHRSVCEFSPSGKRKLCRGRKKLIMQTLPYSKNTSGMAHTVVIKTLLHFFAILYTVVKIHSSLMLRHVVHTVTTALQMVQWLHHYDALSESILYRWYSNVKVTA
jgi:hypothetical protein